MNEKNTDKKTRAYFGQMRGLPGLQTIKETGELSF